MTFTSTHFSFSVGVPRGSSQYEPQPAYQTLFPSVPGFLAVASNERTEERLAEELDLRLHLDSLPLPRSVRLNEYNIPSDGIRWDIIDRNISKMLGEEAYLWNRSSRSETGHYTIYATRPLTVSQLNDLKTWSAQANEEDEIAATISRKLGKLDEEYRAKERELIRLERAEREARDQDRWRREKIRRELEREVAWEERKREEKRRYVRQMAIVEEEFRLAQRMKDRLNRMDIQVERDDATLAAEDDDEIPDESEWRKALLIRRHFARKREWTHGDAASKKKRGWKANSRVSSIGCSSSKRLQDGLVNLQWEVLT